MVYGTGRKKIKSKTVRIVKDNSGFHVAVLFLRGDKMNLDEAIEHLKEKLDKDSFDCVECKNEHEQLLKWLLELKQYRERNKIF